MSFFNFIDQELEEQPSNSSQSSEIEGKIGESPEPIGKKNENIRHHSKNKPEKLKFLKPCPLCESRDFVCTEKGGFFCIQCKPGAIGSPVIAKGSWDMPEMAPTPDMESDINQEDSKEEKRSTQMDTHGLYFKAAFPWIMDHLAELYKAGWTRPALFRRGKHHFPIGEWGVAWYPIWTKSNLKINIRKRSGAIRFSFVGTDDRAISQAAYPPQGKN